MDRLQLSTYNSVLVQLQMETDQTTDNPINNPAEPTWFQPLVGDDAPAADCARCRARANQARVRLAETLCKTGDKSAAKRIYNAIRRSDADAPKKKAAELALKVIG